MIGQTTLYLLDMLDLLVDLLVLSSDWSGDPSSLLDLFGTVFSFNIAPSFRLLFFRFDFSDTTVRQPQKVLGTSSTSRYCYSREFTLSRD